jgi:predicted peroxiredoxin
MQIQLENKMEETIKKYIENCKENGIQITWDFLASKCGFGSRQALKSVCKSSNPSVVSIIKIAEGLKCPFTDLITYKVTK